MKTIEELFKEKEGYYTKMLETSQKYYNFDKPVSLDREQMKEYKKILHEGQEEKAQQYYTSIKEITEKNRLEKKGLQNQKNIYKLADEMIDINIIITFETLHKKKILEILNKYVKKKVGEKTKKKIEEELRGIDDNIKRCYLSINGGLVGNDNNVKFVYSDYYIEITLNKDVPGTWLNENGEEIKDVYNYDTYNYKYIDNILQLATQKVEEKEKLEKEIEEEIKAIREKIRNFNNFYCKSERGFKIDEYSIFR